MKPIAVNTPVITQEDRVAVLRCLEIGWISSEGPQVAEFEQAFAARMNREYGTAVSSGTAALDIAVRALDLGSGDEVIVPSLTIISCATSIISAGATPVPVDCDLTDWNANLYHFEKALTANTRAVLLVHLYGLCADLDPILNWAENHNLKVIEDASQAMGLKYRTDPCGSFGHCSIFSLYANKLVTTGEGGMLLSNSQEFANQCRSLRNLCFDPKRRFWHEDIGWNYRLSAMQAALGTSQLARLDELVRKKTAIGNTYHKAFNNSEYFHLAPQHTPYCDNVYWVFGLVVKPEAPFTRDEIVSELARSNIGTRTFFYGLHQQPALLKRRYIRPMTLPVTERLADSGFYLPSGLGLSRSDQERVIETVTDFTKKFE